MASSPRTRNTSGAWSNNRIDSSKPFNLKFYPNATTIDRWTEISFRNRGTTIDMPKNSFSIEKMCYEQGMGSRNYKGCYYPTVDGNRYGKDNQKRYGTPTLIFTLQNNKGENVGYTNQTYYKQNMPETFSYFNPQSLSLLHHEYTWKDKIDYNKLGNDGKVYGKAFVALFPALPDVPQVHPSVYDKFSAESISRQFFTEYNESKYLSQQDGRLASNVVNFEIQVLVPTPTITVKKKQVKVI